MAMHHVHKISASPGTGVAASDKGSFFELHHKYNNAAVVNLKNIFPTL
jgi:hypothetical protein